MQETHKSSNSNSNYPSSNEEIDDSDNFYKVYEPDPFSPKEARRLFKELKGKLQSDAVFDPW